MDDMVKIYDIAHLKDRPADGTFDLEAYERSIEDKLVANHKKIPFAQPESEDADEGMADDAEESKEPAASGDKEDDWSDDSDSDDDSDEDSDMSDGRKHKKRNKKLNQKGNSVGLSKKMLEKEKRKDFFRGL